LGMREAMRGHLPDEKIWTTSCICTSLDSVGEGMGRRSGGRRIERTSEEKGAEMGV